MTDWNCIVYLQTNYNIIQIIPVAQFMIIVKNNCQLNIKTKGGLLMGVAAGSGYFSLRDDIIWADAADVNTPTSPDNCTNEGPKYISDASY
jgi:hypothetical protein